jgi:hypothetical protein
MFCNLLMSTGNEMLLRLQQVASAVFFDLCDSKTIYDIAIATDNEKAITDILVCLCPPEPSPNSTLPRKDAMVMKLLSFIVEQCQPWCTNAVNTVLEIHHANLILKSLHSASNRTAIQWCIIEFIQLGHLPEWWDAEIAFPLSSQEGEKGNCIGEQVCSTSLDRQRFELAISFSSLLLTAAWHSSSSLQQPETCQRLLNRLRGSSLNAPNLLCSYGTGQTMGLEYDATLIETQTECEDLRGQLKDEKDQRLRLQVQLAQSEKLLEEERDASNALQQYLESAEREGFKVVQELRSAKEDYVELLADADRKVHAVEREWREKELLSRADHYRREGELKDEVADMRSTLDHTKEELHLEKQRRTELEGQMESNMAQSNNEVGGDNHGYRDLADP